MSPKGSCVICNKWSRLHKGACSPCGTRAAGYSLLIEEWLEFYEKQNGGCAICGRRNSIKELHIDHDHHTLEVRGLLCRTCNLGLGQFDDDRNLLLRAEVYLSRTVPLI